MGASHPLTPAASGNVAVTRDSKRVFVASVNTARLLVWDTELQAATTVHDFTTYTDLVAHPALDRVLAGMRQGFGPVLTLFALDEFSGARLASNSADFGSHLSLSLDGTRLYDTMVTTTINPSSGGHVKVYDPQTLTLTSTFRPCCFPRRTVDAPSRNRMYVVEDGGGQFGIKEMNRTTGETLVTLPTEFSNVGAVVSADELRLWMATQQTTNEPSANALTILDLDTFTVAGRIPFVLRSPLLLAATPPGATRCSYSVNTRQSSWVREGGTATITLSTGCAWQASVGASWLHIPPDAVSGVGTRTIDVTVDPFFGGDASRSASLVIGGQVVTFTQAGFGAQAAYGSFDGPADNTTGITGSLAVTGWALDDVGVTRVSIFRDPVAGEPGAQIYIGDATLVEGARPDVAAIFPSAPFATRAGWGYLLLTNMLPNGGDGAYRIHAYADDVDGHTTLLGSKTISCSNSTATLPFGTIDTPGQGESVSGTITNWGWVLTPQPGSSRPTGPRSTSSSTVSWPAIRPTTSIVLTSPRSSRVTPTRPAPAATSRSIRRR